jgi:hypothetical protein
MVHQETAEFLQFFNNLKVGSLKKDWSLIWSEESKIGEVVEHIEDLIYFSVLARPYHDVAAMESFIGKLAIAQVLLPHVKDSNGSFKQFETVGRSLEDVIAQMLLESRVVQAVIKAFENGSSLEQLVDNKPDSEQAAATLMTLSGLMLFSDVSSLEGEGCCGDDEECADECDE